MSQTVADDACPEPIPLEEMSREQLLDLLTDLLPARPHDWEPPEEELSLAPDWLAELGEPELGPGSWLGELAPSSTLLAELEQLPEEAIDNDFDAVEVVAHWDRLEALCAARKRLAAAALARRDQMAHGLAGLDRLRKKDARGRGVVVSNPCIAGDEIAMRIGITRRAARRLINSGQVMRHVGIPTREAFEAGKISAVKADMILDALTDLSADAALDVQDEVLDKASHVPSGTVRRDLTKACATVDPDEFEDRCEQAKRTRRVDRPRPLPHGMASLYAVMPAAEAMTVYRALEAGARSTKAGGDERTMDQLRADALALLGATAIESGWIGPCDGVQCGRVPEAGPLADGVGGTERTDPEDVPRMRVGTIGGRSAHIRVTVPFTSLMTSTDEGGSDPPGVNEPADLEGYGPIPASVARALAAGNPWQRLVSDPVDRSVLELSTTHYKPPPAMADLIRATHPQCVRPGCGVSSDSCDLHHEIPWPIGPTTARNMAPGCRPDHLLLTHAGWYYTYNFADRSRSWTTATGHRYIEFVDGKVVMERPLPERPPAPPPGLDDPPPF